jgi:hypothetical protein
MPILRGIPYWPFLSLWMSSMPATTILTFLSDVFKRLNPSMALKASVEAAEDWPEASVEAVHSLT